MKKYVVLSTNNNPDYYFYVPIVEWAWNQLGWNVALFYTHDFEDPPQVGLSTLLCKIPEIKGVRTGTLAQVARHFSSHMMPKESYILLSDIDMIPLSDFIQPDMNKKQIWGWDLTGYGFIPVSYIGMSTENWKDVMQVHDTMAENMEQEMKANGRAYKEKWEDYWDADWDILTQKVTPRKGEFEKYDRGLVHLAKDPTAKGRADRYDLEKTMNQTPLLDMHGHNVNPAHPVKWQPMRAVLEKAFGKLPGWMDAYVGDFYKKHGY